MRMWKVEDGRDGEEENARDQEPATLALTTVATWGQLLAGSL